MIVVKYMGVSYRSTNVHTCSVLPISLHNNRLQVKCPKKNILIKNKCPLIKIVHKFMTKLRKMHIGV